VDDCSSNLRIASSMFSKLFQHFEQLSGSEKENIVGELRRASALYDVMDFSRTISMPGATPASTVNVKRKFLCKWNQMNSTVNTSMQIVDIVIAER